MKGQDLKKISLHFLNTWRKRLIFCKFPRKQSHRISKWFDMSLRYLLNWIELNHCIIFSFKNAKKARMLILTIFVSKPNVVYKSFFATYELKTYSRLVTAPEPMYLYWAIFWQVKLIDLLGSGFFPAYFLADAHWWCMGSPGGGWDSFALRKGKRSSPYVVFVLFILKGQ